MSAETIESYLVGLGFDIDQPSLSKFHSSLKAGLDHVASFAGGAAGDLLKFQVAGVTAFAAVGFGLIGLMDKLAMGDQQTRLFAMRSFMTIQQARSVQTALSVLGASIDDVAWDKELHGRFETLIQDQKRLNLMLGPNYEKQMISIRDVEFQLQRLEVKGEYFGMKFASDLLKKLGFGDGGILNQLEKLNDFVEKNMPAWADELSTDIIPIWNDFWHILSGLAGLAIDLGVDFTRMVGIITGDSALDGKTISFHNFATAVGKAADELARLIGILHDTEQFAAHTLGAVLFGIKDFTGTMNGETDAQRTANQASAHSELSKAWHYLFGDAQDSKAVTSTMAGQVDNAVDASALVKAIISVESAGHQTGKDGTTLTSDKGALGLMQLEPSTAKDLGIDPNDPKQNVEGGSRYIQQLIDRYGGNIDTALVAYNWGMGHVDRAIKNGTPFDPGAVAYAREVEKRAGIQVGSINVNVPPTAHTPEEIAAFVQRGVQGGLNDHTDRMMTESGGAYQ
jgi:hypothetical protein